MSVPTNLPLEELRALLEKATKGPWTLIQFKSDPPHAARPAMMREPANWELIVAAVNALPDLLAAAEEVASLKAENEKLRAFAEHCLDYDLADIRSRASEALATLPQEGK